MEKEKKDLEDFLELEYEEHIREHIREGKKRVSILYSKLIRYSPSLGEYLLENPEDFFSLARMVLNDKYNLNAELRIKNTPDSIKKRIRDIRSKDLNVFLCFEGIVESKSDVRPQIVSAKFECPNCGNVINTIQDSSKFKEPNKCGCGRRGKFKVVGKETTDAFTIKIQELPEQVDYDPELKRLHLFFSKDLAESKIEERIFQGMRIKVSGILKEVPIIKRDGSTSTRLDYIFEVNYVNIFENDFIDNQPNIEEMKRIEKIAKSLNPVRKISSDIYSHILGYDEVKDALVLQLFGGVTDYTHLTKERGEIHILMIGEPGTAKTDFIKLQEKYASKATSINSKTASEVGFVGCVEKDEFLGGYTFRAGPIPLAHRGICTVDEFNTLDKKEKNILLEPMESGSVSINKASINRKFSAHTSFLIASNPKFDYFDNYEDLFEQCEISAPLMSRIDLTFKFVGSHDEELETAKAFLILTRKRKEPSYSPEFIKKYLAIAKQINPEFPKELIDYFSKLYGKFRASNKPSDKKGFPITARILNTIKRVAEARARICLRTVINKEDIDFGLEIVKKSLMITATDVETGEIDEQKIETGIGSSERKLMYIIMDCYSEISDDKGLADLGSLYLEVEKKSKIELFKIEEEITKLITNGIFYEPRRGVIKKIK